MIQDATRNIKMKKQLIQENNELKRTIDFNVKLNSLLMKRIEKLNKEVERLKNKSNKRGN